MDDQLKQQLLPAFAVFNLTIGIYMIARMVMGGIGFWDSFWTQIAIGIGIGIVTGGITLGVSMLGKK